ncbi:MULTISPECIES: HAD family phosphatase [Acidobacteriaceae]|uniref:HAD family hydrolase n=1 Tax=Acidobacteriaceae TaxID=204434 RepID=UPI0020B16986|nr:MULTISPECIES: HAD family phosphatase [Acidobacteriaceae]MDW5266610.1 HAD family phosphatase [Edaphobacter sp.]
MRPIQAVLFDFGQVLSLSADPAVWQQMLAISGLSEADLDREYWAHRHEYDRGTLNGQTYWQKVAAGSHATFTPEQIAALIAADVNLWSRLNLPMVEWAQHLQRAGVRTGILSNIGDAMAEGLIAKFDWISAFDHCVWSHSLKLAKPEAAIYRCAAEGLATDPSQILFIDDKIENIEAAEAVGMQAIQYHLDHPAFEQELRRRNLDYLLNESPAATT